MSDYDLMIDASNPEVITSSYAPLHHKFSNGVFCIFIDAYRTMMMMMMSTSVFTIRI